MTTNIVQATFSGAKATITRALYQYDYGQILRIVGIDLPSLYEVHFSNGSGTTKTAIGDVDGVIIPDEYLITGNPVFAWIFLHTGADDGETRYQIKIPVNSRPKPSDEPVIEPDRSAISNLVTQVETIVDEIGDLLELETQDKSSLVNAINEAAQTGGGTGIIDTELNGESVHAVQNRVIYEALQSKANSSDIPSLSGYATENWVNQQGFLKEHQSLSNYYTKIEVDAIIGDVESLLAAI